MVGVAQLAEHLVVVQVVAGSNPVTHPDHAQGPDFRGSPGPVRIPLFFRCLRHCTAPGFQDWVLQPVQHAARPRVRHMRAAASFGASPGLGGSGPVRPGGPFQWRSVPHVGKGVPSREAASVGFAVRSAGGARRGSPALIPDQAVRSSSRLLFSGYRRDLDQSVRRGPVIPKPHSRTCFFSVA